MQAALSQSYSLSDVESSGDAHMQCVFAWYNFAMKTHSPLHHAMMSEEKITQAKMQMRERLALVLERTLQQHRDTMLEWTRTDDALAAVRFLSERVTVAARACVERVLCELICGNCTAVFSGRIAHELLVHAQCTNIEQPAASARSCRRVLTQWLERAPLDQVLQSLLAHADVVDQLVACVRIGHDGVGIDEHDVELVALLCAAHARLREAGNISFLLLITTIERALRL